MFTLKLNNDWENYANERIVYYEGNKRKTGQKIPKRQIKEIYKLISKMQVIEEGKDYIIYGEK